MLFDDDPRYGMALIFAFMVFVFLLQHLGEPAASQGLVWLPAAIVMLPIAVFGAAASVGGSAGIVLLLIAFAGMGLYYNFAGRILGNDMVFWGILAAVILLVAR